MSEKKQQNVSKLSLGMLFGIIFGSIISVLVFLATNNPLSFVIIGIFLVIGLIFGQLWESKVSKDNKSKQD